MNVKSKQTEKKLNGVFYTPFEIVDFLSSWVIDKQEIVDVLEPSAGDGRFVKKIVEFADKVNVTAVEIDPLECEIIKAIDNTKVINDDFYITTQDQDRGFERLQVRLDDLDRKQIQDVV